MVTDSAVLDASISTLLDSGRINQYKTVTDRLVKQLSNDSRLVYRTKERELSSVGAAGDSFYSTYGTKYKVKPNTKSRANNKKYNDPRYKRNYEDRTVKTQRQYYY